MAGIPEGHFIWYELLTKDVPAAAAFYAEVIGWDVLPNTMNDLPYTLFGKGESAVAGLMELPAEAAAKGAMPSWMGHVAVADVDAVLARAESLGGRVYHPAEEIANVGRFAVLGDPQGAALGIFAPACGGEGPPPLAKGAPGSIGWHELMAADAPAVLGFYEALFGWAKEAAIPMGAMGSYQLLRLGAEVSGGAMTKPPAVPFPFWGYYITVESIGAAKGRLEARGGRVLNGPMPVPGGAWILQALDPQGVYFCLTSQAA